RPIDHLGIPNAEYDAIVCMPSIEISSICSSLSSISDTVTISVLKQVVTSSAKGDIGSGNITCKQRSLTDK
ncbi:Proliferating cell nuclear antigen, partial [Bienertia sinuspersici]